MESLRRPSPCENLMKTWPLRSSRRSSSTSLVSTRTAYRRAAACSRSVATRIAQYRCRFVRPRAAAWMLRVRARARARIRVRARARARARARVRVRVTFRVGLRVRVRF